MQAEIQKMLDKDVIETSNSPSATSVVLVRKKDGGWRFCIDFRKLNLQTKAVAFTLPNVEDV